MVDKNVAYMKLKFDSNNKIKNLSEKQKNELLIRCIIELDTTIELRNFVDYNIKSFTK